jgi:phospholipase/carboxylesterase
MPEVDFVHQSEPGTGRPLLLLHGTGGDEFQLLQLGRMLAPEAPLLSPRGRSLEEGMARFFRRHGEGRLDVEDLQEKALELADWVDARAPEPPLAVGYSNGANMASAILLLRPHTLAGGILFRAMLPFEPAQPPDLAGRRVLIVAGLADPMVPEGDPDRLAGTLRRAGAEVAVSYQPAGHELGASDIAAARDWIQGLPGR